MNESFDERWLGREFELNYAYLQSCEARSQTIIQVYFTLAGASGALMVEFFDRRLAMALPFAVGLLGIVLSGAHRSLRASVVVAARQINAIRKWYRERLSDEPGARR